jgi:uncharacterized membrane protein
MIGDDLSTPRGLRRRRSYNPEAPGMFAESFARFFGTVRFLVIQTFIVAIWITFNVVAFTNHFDPYPFILLNLMFSTQAAYAAPLILLAQNRQADRDRLQVERDRDANARTAAFMDFLAREMAAIRISLESKIDREGLDEALQRLTAAIEAQHEGATERDPVLLTELRERHAEE